MMSEMRVSRGQRGYNKKSPYQYQKIIDILVKPNILPLVSTRLLGTAVKVKSFCSPYLVGYTQFNLFLCARQRKPLPIILSYFSDCVCLIYIMSVLCM